MREKKFCVMVAEEGGEVHHRLWVSVPIDDRITDYKILVAENDRLKLENQRLTAQLSEIDDIINPF